MLQAIYLTLFVLGTVLQYAQFIPFLIEHGFDISLFVEQLFANRISSFFGIDVIVSVLVVITFIAWEGTRIKMKHLWVYFTGTLLGVAVGLPLFLLMRQRHLEATAPPD
jgi:Terpene cyclase DEP1